ncbi:hypothetical protein ANSO36C_54250 [Nostoc cf. commune SO-36]|uniref:Uncharacterized protein n=1 Tax=Nostoc cf. commune SO-36 TaxID=449208 RepID=A0ABN6QDM5_NOSCO|nr:hypothetical protein ANSO36C_54250 [Nostoc cf. commune SO-36]
MSFCIPYLGKAIAKMKLKTIIIPKFKASKFNCCFKVYLDAKYRPNKLELIRVKLSFNVDDGEKDQAIETTVNITKE